MLPNTAATSTAIVAGLAGANAGAITYIFAEPIFYIAAAMGGAAAGMVFGDLLTDADIPAKIWFRKIVAGFIAFVSAIALAPAIVEITIGVLPAASARGLTILCHFLVAAAMPQLVEAMPRLFTAWINKMKSKK